MKRIIELTLLTLLLNSCSVKEYRYPCHCYLRMDMSECLHVREGLLLSLEDGDGRICRYHYPESSGEELEFEISRGKLQVSVKGLGQSDSIFACCSSMEIRDEFNYLRPRLKKQFATIDLDPTAVIGENANYTAAVSASSASLDPMTLKPGGTAFSRIFIPGEDGRCFIVVPRQADDALKVNLSCEDGASLEILLGRLLRERGYDWNSENLQDIRVILDNKELSIRIEVKDWDL